MKNGQLISVIIPVYNQAAFLADAVKSVLEQDYQSIEIVIVDDGSTDNSAQVAESFKENKVRCVSQSNQGAAAARNTGIQSASGELIAFLDADDYWLSGKLCRQIEFLQLNPEVDGCLVRFRNFLQEGAEQPCWVTTESLGESGSLAHSPCTLLVKRDVFTQVGLFDVEYKLASDAEWFFRAKDSVANLAILDEVFVMRRVHATNLGHQVLETRLAIMKLLKESADRQTKSR